MEVIIHGTKGGYRKLYITPNSPKTIIMDVRPDTNYDITIGQSAYSIAFAENGNVENGAVFTKYNLIRDMLRNESSLGNIAFSLYMPNIQKLSGMDIKSMLDRLSDEYCSKYIENNYIGNKSEDWSFVDEIIRNYENKQANVFNYNRLDFQSGKKEAAYIYYESTENLLNFFDDPYHEEFLDYKQVFFIESWFIDKSINPLRSLRHGSGNNLTGAVSDKYELQFEDAKQRGVKIEVYVGGKSRLNKSKIIERNNLKITYNKDFHFEEIIEGTWNEIKKEWPERIEIDDVHKVVKIEPVILKPKQKDIIFKVEDVSYRTIPDAVITIQEKSDCGIKKIPQLNQNNEIVVSFEGDDIGKVWTLFSYANGYKEDYKDFTPSIISPVYHIYLKNQKRIKIIVLDEESKMPVCHYGLEVRYYNAKLVITDITELVFNGDEIDFKWTIEVSSDGYEKKQVYFSPKNHIKEEPKEIKLKKNKVIDKAGSKPSFFDKINQKIWLRKKIIQIKQNQ